MDHPPSAIAAAELDPRESIRDAAVPLWRTALVVLLATATWYACTNLSAINTELEAGVIMTLPERVGEFTGIDQAVTREEKTILPGDTEFARKLYSDGKGNEILCSIVLSGGDKRSIHRAEICLPGQGWTIGSGEVVSVPLNSGRLLKVTNLRISREISVDSRTRRTLRTMYWYWFVGKDRTTPSHLDRTLVSAWDRLFRRTNHRWAYVIVSPIAMAPGGVARDTATVEMLQRFIREIVPAFQKSEMAEAAAADRASK